MFIFVWTPILQLTAKSDEINVGMIYVLVIISFLIQNKVLEFLYKTFNANFFIMCTTYLVFYISTFILIYTLQDFKDRMIALSIVGVYSYLILLGIWRIC